VLPSTNLHRYVTVVVIVALAGAVGQSLLGMSWPAWTARGLAVTAVLVVGLMVGEWLPIRIWRGDWFREYTFSGTFTVALLITGPFWLALTVQSSALLVAEIRQHRPRLKVAFNLGQYALSMLCARGVYAALTDQPFGAYTARFSTDQLLPSLVAAAVYFIVNVLLVSLVLALANDERILPSVAGQLREELSMTTMLLCMAPVVVLSLQFSLLAAPLCLLPIVAVRHAARTTAESNVRALHDSLTGLPNRTLLMQRCRRSAELARDGEQTALLLVDLDHFKEINDTLGHDVGDELLRLVSARLLRVVRDGDIVARFGGDEFAVVCPGLTDVGVAETLSQRFADALAEPFGLEQISLHVGASVGIALLPLHADGVEQLVQHADVALYEAKSERGSTQTYDPKHDFNSVGRLALMEELRAGLGTQLVLHYQPKCRASDGALVGVEVLIRWQHPVHGLMYPHQFLPAAENSGLIVPMTMLILREALQQVRRWHAEGFDVNVAVNMSPRHLTDIHLPDQLRALLEAEDLPGSVLTVEVTEDSIMSDPARAGEVLCRLRSIGIAVSIDDFGTGYSSLAYLRDLSATEVKIDQTFVLNASTNERDLAIVKAAADLGHSLGLQVVAEGIEDTTTAGLMAQSGCDLLQGYLILPPAPAEELLAWSKRPQVWTRGLPVQLPHAPASSRPSDVLKR
jgi:diguanylate cyclase (GGDEF)-like protein